MLSMIGRPVARPQPRLWPRLRLILLALILLLGIANLAIIGLRSLDRPGKPEPGALLYATTFDGNNDDWSMAEGQNSAQIVDGRLVLTVSELKDGVFSTLDYQYSDFDVRVNATRLTFDDEYNEVGLLFRVQSPDNYYIFKIRDSDGAYRIERCKGCQLGQADVISEWHSSPAILSGVNVVNQLRVVAKGNHFSFFVNDQPLSLCLRGSDKYSTWSGDECLSNNKQISTELVDDTFGYGEIGVGAVSGVSVAFDEVLIFGV